MANEFNIAEDIKVEIYVPLGGTYGYAGVWNLTQWDNALWASSSSYGWEWKDVVATISNAEISIGAPVESGHYVPATPNTLALTMQSTVYDPFIPNSGTRAGTPIRLSYRANPDTAPSTWTYIFQGTIDTFDVTYDPNGLNLIDIQASSSIKKLLNKNMSVWNNAGTTVTGIFTQWATEIGASSVGTNTYWFNDYYGYNYATDYINDVSGGDVLNYLNEVECGMVLQDPVTDGIVGYSTKRFRTLLASTPTNSASNTHSTATTHFCITDIGFTYDSDSVYNSYIVESSAAPGTNVTRKDQDLIDLYGELRFEKTLHLASPTDITSWETTVVARNPSRRVNMVQTLGIRRDRKLANLTALLPMNALNVNVETENYTVDENSVITHTTHSITPTTWFVTLELWKGF